MNLRPLKDQCGDYSQPGVIRQREFGGKMGESGLGWEKCGGRGMECKGFIL